VSHSRRAGVTADVLKEYKEILTNTTSDLEEHLQEIDNRLQTLSLQGSSMTDEDVTERERVQEEKDSTKKCLAICTQASEHADQVKTNVFEDVSAAKDAHQVIVSTLGDLISAKRVTAGVGATQLLGQMSDASLQQLLKGRGI
jgi:Fungal N-terminal domain of STAND proteins